jgi:hypothetical protein
MEAGIRCSYPVTGFSRFCEELAGNKHNLTLDMGVVFLLPNLVISRGFLTRTSAFPAGSYRKLVELDS